MVRKRTSIFFLNFLTNIGISNVTFHFFVLQRLFLILTVTSMKNSNSLLLCKPASFEEVILAFFDLNRDFEYSFFLCFRDLFFKSHQEKFEEISCAHLMAVSRAKKNLFLWRKHSFFPKNLICHFLTQIEISKGFSHIFRTSRTFSSNVILTNLNNYRLHIFELFQENNLPLLANTSYFSKKNEFDIF